MQQQLTRVAENLYQSESSGLYYAIFSCDGKQIKRRKARTWHLVSGDQIDLSRWRPLITPGANTARHRRNWRSAETTGTAKLPRSERAEKPGWHYAI